VDTGRILVTVSHGVEAEGMINGDGDLVVPASHLEQLELVPGQRVTVTIMVARRPRMDMYGFLADKIPDVPLEEFEEASRAAWEKSASA
jgi:hypothetical protein